MALAGGCARDAGDDAEDRAKSVVDAVDGIADPTAGLHPSSFTGLQHGFQRTLGLPHCLSPGPVPVRSRQFFQRPTLVLLVLQHLVENSDAALIAETL